MLSVCVSEGSRETYRVVHVTEQLFSLLHCKWVEEESRAGEGSLGFDLNSSIRHG